MMQRESIKRERDLTAPGSFEEASLQNLNKALGQRWKAMPESEKRIYQDLFKEKVEQFKVESLKYIRDNPGAVIYDDGTTGAEASTTSIKVKEGENLPKKPGIDNL